MLPPLTNNNIMFEPVLIELTPIEKDVERLLLKAGFCLQTYRTIDAMSILEKALDIVENNNVQWRIKSAVYKDYGQAHVQMGNIENGLIFFIKSYQISEDDNDKAANASMIAGYYLRKGDTQKAAEYAEKAIQTANATVLQCSPYHIQGGIAEMEGNHLKAIKLMNKAAELAEMSHSLTDLGMIIMDLSVIFTKLGKPEIALSEICRAERYIKESRNLDLFMRCTIRKAKILYMMGKDEEARVLIIALDEHKN